MEVRTKTVIFRFPQPLGEARLTPDPELHRLLLHAAETGSSIEVRGRTDATYADPLNRRLAAQRARQALQFLLQNGIRADKIHSNFLAAGDHIADNKTPAGQARNRRIEIEARNLDTTEFQSVTGDASRSAP